MRKDIIKAQARHGYIGRMKREARSRKWYERLIGLLGITVFTLALAWSGLAPIA